MEEESKPSNGQLKLLNLEKDLAGPNRHEVYRRHDETLASLQKRIMEEQRNSLPPEEYQQAEKLRLGVIAARKVLKFALSK